MKANRFVGVLLRVSKKELKVQNPTGKSSLFFLSAWNKQLFAVITDVYSRGLTLLKVLKMLRFLKYYLFLFDAISNYNNIICNCVFFICCHFIPFGLHYSGNRFYFQTRVNFIDPPNYSLLIVGMIRSFK
jgi:hypothetical protein